MAALFGTSWMCLLLAGLWSLFCGALLRRAWTSEADEEGARQIMSLRNDATRLRADVETRNGQVRALETDLGTSKSEVQAMKTRFASIETQIADIDSARAGAVKLTEDRDRTISVLNARVSALESELSNAKADADAARAAGTNAASTAAAELAKLRQGWDAERAKLVSEHGNKLTLLETSKAELNKSKGSEIAALLAKVAGLAVFESQVRELTPKVAAAEAELTGAKRMLAERDTTLNAANTEKARAAATLKQRDDELAGLKARIAESEPWKQKFGEADAELGRLRARLAAAEPWQAKYETANADLTKLRARVAELEPWQQKSSEADVELGRLRARLAAAEPWQAKFESTNAELPKLRARISELEPFQSRFNSANTELGTLRSRLAELEPWQGRFNQSDAELTRLRARVAELQPLQDQLRTLNANHETVMKQRDDRVRQLEAEIQELMRRIEALRNAPPRVVEKIVEVEKIVTVAAAPVATPLAAPIRARDSGTGKRDDLKIVEGIGPKIEKLLNNAGYLTFRSVAEADPAALALIMEAAGPRFKLARTDTWPEQARLLADNNMEAFKKLTDELKGGVRR